MKPKIKIIVTVLSLMFFISCSKEEISNIENNNKIGTDSSLNFRHTIVQTPDWYNMKMLKNYIDGHDGYHMGMGNILDWIKINTLVKDNNVIGIYSKSSISNYEQIYSHWRKTFCANSNEYNYEITVRAKYPTVSVRLDVNEGNYWWDDITASTLPNTSTTLGSYNIIEFTYFIKRSDLDSYESTASTINGNSPE